MLQIPVDEVVIKDGEIPDTVVALEDIEYVIINKKALTLLLKTCCERCIYLNKQDKELDKSSLYDKVIDSLNKGIGFICGNKW